MRTALITDTHFGGRSDSPAFNEYFFKFWENTFFPYIEKHGITRVIHLGDAVDRRKFINYVTLNALRTRFIQRLSDLNVQVDVIVGNHDVPYKNTNEVNAIQELFGSYKNLTIHSKATTINVDGLDIAIIPWIHATNYQETLDYIKKTPAQIAMGHLEVQGFEMDRGVVCQTGMDREAFRKFDMVMTGHFHHKSTDGHIFYLGNTYEMTWADYGDRRGFHVFDTQTRDLEHIVNPYKMFHKIPYDETQETLESVDNKDFSMYHNTMVKVVVANKTNPVLFDHFMSSLYRAQPLDISIVEDFTDYSTISDEDIVNQADDTMMIVDKTIDGIQINVDSEKLKAMMRQIYNEAQNLETTRDTIQETTLEEPVLNR